MLLLAMGVGVLIGRSGNPKQPAPLAQQTITQTAPTNAGLSGATSEVPFRGDWPRGAGGYTVQLQALSQTGTSVSAVEAAKNAAASKGATEVGALKSDEFASLTAGKYVIYSGVFRKKADATKALAGLKPKFPGAKILALSTHGASTGSAASSGGSSSGSSVAHPAPSSVLEGLKGAKSKSYEEKSKNLPDVVSTG